MFHPADQSLEPLTGTTETLTFRVSASLLARKKTVIKSLAVSRTRWLAIKLENAGAAIAMRIPMIPITTISSTSVKPRAFTTSYQLPSR